MAKDVLARANKAKNDEFYTRLPDIENELRHYKKFFENKTVLCNCDDPFESNFFKYFANNFNYLRLKKLICVCYAESPIAGGEFVDDIIANKKPYRIEITEVCDLNGDGAEDIDDIELLLRNNKNNLTILDGDGDFRSEESIEFLKESDIVVTNPPFSLFREFVDILIKYDKKFLIIGNQNALTYKEIFPLIQEDKLWIGYNPVHLFIVPSDYSSSSTFMDGDVKYAKFGNICWYTNLDIDKRHERVILYNKYSGNENKYPKFDNYDAINIDKAADIPEDYYDVMGVPITFLDKYSPDQFEIVGITKTPIGAHLRTKIYPPQIQISKNGDRNNVTKLNDGPSIEIPQVDSNKVCYEVGEKIYYAPYARLLIRRKK